MGSLTNCIYICILVLIYFQTTKKTYKTTRETTKNKQTKKKNTCATSKLSNILARIIKFRLYKIILMCEELSYEIIDTLVVSQAVFCYN